MTLFFILLLTRLFGIYVESLLLDDCPIENAKNLTIGGSLTIAQDDIGFYEYTEEMIASYKLFRDWLHYERADHLGIVVFNETYCLRMYLEEDNANPDTVTSIYANQVAEGLIDVFLGPFSSYLAASAIAVTEDNNKFILCPAASSTSLFENSKYAFTMQSPASQTFQPILRELHAEGARTIAYAYDGTSGNAEACKEIEELIRSNDLNMTVIDAIPFTNETIQKTVQDMKDNKVADVFFGCMFDDSCSPFLESMNSTGYEPKAIVLTSCASLPEFTTQTINGGMYILTDVFWSEDFKGTDPITNWTNKEFANRFLDYSNGEKSSDIAAAAFASLEVLVNAIEGTNSTNSKDLVIYIQQMRLDSLYGQIEYDSNNMNTLDLAYLQIDENLELCVMSPSELLDCDEFVYPMITWSQIACIERSEEGSCRCGVADCDACSESDVKVVVSGCDLDNSGTVHYSFKDLDACYADSPNAYKLPADKSVYCGVVSASSSTGICIIIFCLLIISCAVATFLWVFNHRKSKIVLANSPKMLCVLASGVAIFASQCFAYLGTPTSASCSAQVILFTIGFSLIIGSILLVSFRVWRVFGNEKLVRIKIREKDLFKGLTAMLFIDFILIILLFAVYEPSPITEQTSELNDPVVIGSYCLHDAAMINALSLYKFSQAAFALYLSYRTRNVDRRFLQSDFAAVTISLLSIAVLLCYFNISQDAQTESLAICSYIIITCLISLTIMVGPKILLFGKKYEPKRQVSGDNSNNSGNNSSQKSSSNLLSQVTVGKNDFSLLNQEMATIVGPRDTITAVDMLHVHEEEGEGKKTDKTDDEDTIVVQLGVIKEKDEDDDDDDAADKRMSTLSPTDLLELPYKVKKLEAEVQLLRSQLKQSSSLVTNQKREIDSLRVNALSTGRWSMDRFSTTSSSSGGDGGGRGWKFFL